MSYDTLLSLLEGVRPARPRNSKSARAHTATCPLCAASQPGKGIGKLALDETVDGSALVYCNRCGGNGLEIVEALGLDPAVLFPPRDSASTGNGGPAYWMPLAGLLSTIKTVREKVIEAHIYQDTNLFFEVLDLLTLAEKTAKAAMRRGG